MLKVAVFDDYRPYSQMAAAPLHHAGYQTFEVVAEEGSIDWERVLNFGPDVISVGLFRKRAAFNRPITNWEEDVLGYIPLRQMEAYPAVNVLPIVLVGSALEDFDVPTAVNYAVFLTLPDDMHLYVPKVEELARTVKTRRKLSGHGCPCCHARLLFLREPAVDLFCPRCGTSVAIVDDPADPHILYYETAGPENRATRGTLEMLKPRAVERHDVC